MLCRLSSTRRWTVTTYYTQRVFGGWSPSSLHLIPDSLYTLHLMSSNTEHRTSIHTVYDSLIEIHIYTRCDIIVLVLPADLRICQYHDKERGHSLTKHHQMLLKYDSKYAHRVVSSTSQIFMLYVPLSVFAPTHRCKIVRRACANGKQVSRPHGNK